MARMRSRYQRAARTAERIAQAASVQAGKVKIIKAARGASIKIAADARKAPTLKGSAMPAQRATQRARYRLAERIIMAVGLLGLPMKLRACLRGLLAEPAISWQAEQAARFSLRAARLGLRVSFIDSRACEIALHYLGKVTWHPTIEAARRRACARNRGRYKIIYQDALGNERIIEGFSRRNIIKAHVQGLRGIREDFGASRMSISLETRRATFAVLAIGAEVTLHGTRRMSVSIHGGRTDTGKRFSEPVLRCINPSALPEQRIYSFSGYLDATSAPHKRAMPSTERHFDSRDIEARGILQANERRTIASLPSTGNTRARRAARLGNEAQAAYFQRAASLRLSARLARLAIAERNAVAYTKAAFAFSAYFAEREAARCAATARMICGSQSRLLLSA